jgi:hypothetical protein
MSLGTQGTGPVDRRRLTRAQVWFYAVGCVVLAAGLTGSAWAYWRASRNEARDAGVAGTYDTKKYQDQLERIGGKANILATDIQQWFAGLWHGRQLAYTLAALALAAALACFCIARFLPDLPPWDDGRDPKRDGAKE